LLLLFNPVLTVPMPSSYGGFGGIGASGAISGGRSLKRACVVTIILSGETILFSKACLEVCSAVWGCGMQ